MNQIVNEFIKDHQLIYEKDRIIVAVSGGPDSMALLHYLQMVKRDYHLQLIVAHVEHGLRGVESVNDCNFVKSYCEENKLDFFLYEPNVMAMKEELGLSTQEAARFSRYQWFEKLMEEHKATKLAFAHHGDDQVETVLMKQVRGSVVSLQGIPVKRQFGNGMIIRPFLCVEKSDILEYCQEHHIQYRIDQSNDSDNYKRNRFRKYILPFLKEENPSIHKTFQRQSEISTEENEFLQSLAKMEVEKAIDYHQESEICISNQRLLQMPTTLQRRALHLILNYLSLNSGREITVHHFDSIIELIKKASPSGMLHLPKGIFVEKVYDKCLFKVNIHKERPETIQFTKIPIPGMVPLKLGKIHTTVLKNWKSFDAKSDTFIGDIGKLSLPLFVRSRKNGDRLSPYGLDGTKKLKEVFIEKKVPKHLRDQWPVVTDSNDKIIWVPLLKRSNIALVGESTEQVIKIVFDHENDLLLHSI
ncbi:tRNA lysidine(34) synthetase TilS [Evansella cellulosilytica]|uniref:tRNA(Ile)-lysidine synthase n=1 Tax=Evansella cellulosilytica (strain ATCC 21833 / DSM 2522 / FERM P-1141 / JCM 9156 / N-4) TaxID=649639 RepID=E6TSE5_EVAC2|nr:tRNA lysidine(34) synthetase TilS [Evansella cellulosilytica]ADU28360.1 tRNA(Ile)-lysidine synthetase [Evansella cellulosilytica DSM 2522]